MTTSSSRTSSLRTGGILVLALASGLACTAIFKPKDDVQRCGTSDDCEPTGDNRYDAACRFDPENTGLDTTKTDKICVADFTVHPCGVDDWGPMGGEEEGPIQAKFDECDDLVLACDADRLGSEFCERAAGEQCDGDLEPNDSGLCVDPDSDDVVVSGAEFREQAIQDQFCKSFFCDDEFVCDTSSDSPTCVRCDPDAPFGEGGCGLFYANGAPAPFYILGEELEDQCDGPDADPYDTKWNECP